MSWTFGYFSANSSLTCCTSSGQLFWASFISQTVTVPVKSFVSTFVGEGDGLPDEQPAAVANRAAVLSVAST
ncbi:hypothetical protein Kpho01_43000 [Kitasatospora phosalacinea]|uniref:Uncharacterized protein n=1 Tax=Kitasatospora phosalacinea TaxID=2065 RepID=A0A9W6PHK5_9ACTN|nr:hypothetical protein Kpho01_43000 [Kitasatospora phosalacinea]